MSNFTTRECQVLDLIGQGLRGMQIAEQLGVSELTIRKHRSSIMRKAGLQSTAGLIAFARGAATPAAEAPAADPLDWTRLRPREAEIIRHVIAGRTSKEIARLLDISPLTVRKHRERTRDKLGVHSLGELITRGHVAVAASGGLMPEEPNGP